MRKHLPPFRARHCSRCSPAAFPALPNTPKPRRRPGCGSTRATSTAAFAFAPGSARLTRGEDLRLDRLVADGAIRPADRVEIAAAGTPALSAARSAAISSKLLRWGIVADAHPLAGVPPNRAIVIGRALRRDPAGVPELEHARLPVISPTRRPAISAALLRSISG